MKIVFDYDRNYKTSVPSVIALGTFDGIHLGHRKLINELQKQKNQYGYQTIVYTFLNHPFKYLKPEMEPHQIMLLGEKINEFAKLGVDVLILTPFDSILSHQSPDNFLKQLSQNILIKSLVVGFNFRFGYKGAGDQFYLEHEAFRRGWKFSSIPSVKIENEVVSSTLIRKMIMEGRVAEVTNMLTQPYFIRGTVIHGYGRGKSLGFPTANLCFSLKKVKPLNGVYLTKCKCRRNEYWGITNVGTNPTFSNRGIHIETHLLDFNENIYDETITIQFYNWLRPENKYNDPEDLILQITRDRIKAKKLIYKKR